MGAPLDLTGQIFGRLTVLSKAPNRIMGNGDSRRAWNCECECGNKIIATTLDLRKGDVRSCGCLKSELDRTRSRTHGETKSRLHNIWQRMRSRCSNVNSQDYAYYGGRGIRVYPPWDKDYMCFRDWALSNGYRDDLTIDRIDVNKGYCPENCRWTTMKVQANNRTNSRYITCNGETHTIQEWSEIVGINYQTLYMRFNAGWSPEKALNK